MDDDPFQASARRSVLERRFPKVERADSAADALILVQHPAYSSQLSLVVIDLHMPGLRGPSFVAELRLRLARIPLLVLGRSGEQAKEYEGAGIHFLPWRASTEQMLASALRIVSPSYPRVA